MYTRKLEENYIDEQIRARIKNIATLTMARPFNFWRNLTYNKPTLGMAQC